MAKKAREPRFNQGARTRIHATRVNSRSDARAEFTI